jgi:hypothetical protein
VAKNAGQTVQALLAKAPAPPRRAQVSPPVPAVEPHPAPEDTTNADSGIETAPPPVTNATGNAAQARTRRRSPMPIAPAEPSAPPTLRLSQPTAEALRAAWLIAKRDRVLLTYQDFAGEIITAGLRQASQRGR